MAAAVAVAVVAAAARQESEIMLETFKILVINS